MSSNMRTLLQLWFFYVRKLIAINCIRGEYLTLPSWKALVNANITLYKLTYGGALKNSIKFGPNGLILMKQ